MYGYCYEFKPNTKASDTISGVICVCQSSGGEVVLTKSLKAQNLCKTVFGVKSGDTQSGVKVTVTKLTAQGKKKKRNVGKLLKVR